jgi:hypothetical protein
MESQDLEVSEVKAELVRKHERDKGSRTVGPSGLRMAAPSSSHLFDTGDCNILCTLARMRAGRGSTQVTSAG